MADDVKPAPAIIFADAICDLSGLEPQNLHSYAIVYTDCEGQVGAFCHGVDRMASISLLSAGILNISQDDNPDLIITIGET